MKMVLRASSILATVLVFGTSAEAGTGMLEPSRRSGFEVHASFPSFETDTSATVVELMFRRRMKRDVTLHADLPWARASSETAFLFGGPERIEGSVLGNPYLGLEFGRPGMGWTVEAGVRLPVIPGDPDAKEVNALLWGGLTNFNRGAGAFAVDAVPIEIAFRYRSPAPGGRRSRGEVRLGVEIFVPKGERDESERSFVYQGRYWVDAKPLHFFGAFDGRLIFDEGGDEGELDLIFGGEVENGRLRPGLALRIPTDDLGDILDFVFTVYLGIQ